MQLAPHSPALENGKVVSAIDWIGNRFYVGDRVLYCLAKGNSQQMAMGLVTAIKSIQRMQQEWDFISPENPLENNNSVTRIYDEVSVQVQTLITSFNGPIRRLLPPRWIKSGNVTSLRSGRSAR